MPASQTPDIQTLTDQINDMLAKFNRPGIDTTALVEEQHKNIEALVQATQVANKGAYDVAEKQLELFRAASTQLLSIFSEAEITGKDRAELARQAYEVALNGSREITSMASKAGEDAFSIARQRMTESVEELRKAMTPKPGS